MGTYKEPERQASLAEPIPMQTVHADGLEAVHVGEHVHIIYWAETPRPNGEEGPTERQIVARVALPEAVYLDVCLRLRRGENIIVSEISLRM